MGEICQMIHPTAQSQEPQVKNRGKKTSLGPVLDRADEEHNKADGNVEEEKEEEEKVLVNR